MRFPHGSRPHSGPFLRSSNSQRPDVSPSRHGKAHWFARALPALALAVVAWCGPGAVAAQPAAPADAKDSAAAPLPDAGTQPAIKFEERSPWDAPEPWRTDRFYFQFAYYTWHFHYDADHQQSYLVDGEYHFQQEFLGGQVIAGLALFQNSFGQFSQYLFGGLVWRPIPDNQPFYIKLTAGPLHGYEGQYQNKIPFNSSGTAPAIIPGVGYCVKRYCGEFVLLGANAALFTIGVTLP
jgi:hypothetical protein